MPSYGKKLDQFYRVFATTLDFSNANRAAQLINGWISNSTHGLINDVVTPGWLSEIIEKFVLIFYLQITLEMMLP